MIGDKLELSTAAQAFFSLWIVGSDLGILCNIQFLLLVSELQIRPKLTLNEMVHKWPRYLEKYTHNSEIPTGNSSYKFVFKREALVTKENEEMIEDLVAIKLLYGEARNRILNEKVKCFYLFTN